MADNATYFKLSSDFFAPQCSLLSVLQSHADLHSESPRLLCMWSLIPGSPCVELVTLVVLHAIKETILGFCRVKKG